MRDQYMGQLLKRTRIEQLAAARLAGEGVGGACVFAGVWSMRAGVGAGWLTWHRVGGVSTSQQERRARGGCQAVRAKGGIQHA